MTGASTVMSKSIIWVPVYVEEESTYNQCAECAGSDQEEEVFRFPEGLSGRSAVRWRKLQRKGQDPRMQNRAVYEVIHQNINERLVMQKRHCRSNAFRVREVGPVLSHRW